MKTILISISLFFAISIFSESQAFERPNIVLIMPDDQGWGDHGFLGNEVISTPNIDRLASESAQLTQFYVSPVCSPTRASLMTGRYNYRTRAIDTFQGRSMMDTEEVTLAESLQKAGYRTGIFGKWHLGDCYPMRPQDQGFDETLVHRGGGLGQPSEPLSNRRRYTNPILFRNGVEEATEGYCTDVYFENAMTFIEECQAAEQPFFVYLPTNAPHGPFHDVPTDKFAKYKELDLASIMINDSNTDKLARIAAMIENIDDNIGRLRSHLDKLKLTENTIVIYMVDNGPNSRRYVGNMRGMKAQVHDGGIRSPFLFCWPSEIEAGHSSDRIAAHIDVMPTLLDAAGAELPRDRKIDGRSMLPILRNDRDALKNWSDRALVLQSHRGDQPVAFHHFALRTQKYKLVHPSGFGLSKMPSGVPFELYDFELDPGETKNLAEEFPEILEDLKSQYISWFEDVSSTRADNYAAPRIVLDQQNEPVTVLTRQDWRVSNPDGWGVAGEWELLVADPGRYEVKLIWNKPLAAGEVKLVWDGKLQASKVIQDSTQAVTLSNIELPSGKISLTAFAEATEAESKKIKTDVYQIELTKNEAE